MEYVGWFGKSLGQPRKITKILDLTWRQSEPDLALVLSGIINSALRHDGCECEATQPLVCSLFKLASRAGQDGEARDKIAYIISQFVGFHQLPRSFHQTFEEVVKVAIRFPHVKPEAAGMRAAVDERDAVVEVVDARATAVEGHLPATLAEIEEHWVRTDELVAALEAARAEGSFCQGAGMSGQ